MSMPAAPSSSPLRRLKRISHHLLVSQQPDCARRGGGSRHHDAAAVRPVAAAAAEPPLRDYATGDNATAYNLGVIDKPRGGRDLSAGPRWLEPPRVPEPGYLAHAKPTPVQLTAWVDQFHTDGYLFLPKVLPPKLTAQLRDDLDWALQENVTNEVEGQDGQRKLLRPSAHLNLALNLALRALGSLDSQLATRND
jgi:hypothetical protein